MENKRPKIENELENKKKVDERVQNLLERFKRLDDWEDRYAEIIKFGKESTSLSENQQVEKFRVRGCQSQVWLRPELREGKVYFEAASDAFLVKGIISIFAYVYSDKTPEAILAQNEDFIDELKIREHLSMNRSNGIMHMLKKIKTYAALFKSLCDRGVSNVSDI